MLLTFLDDLSDHRRRQGLRYELKHIILFSIMAVLSNSKSYRDIARYMKKHYERLNKDFALNWQNPPAYTTIRNIIQGVNQEELEKCFRKYSLFINSQQEQGASIISIGVDGKVLRHSFDNFNDQAARQLLSFFNTSTNIILAHEVIDTKTNEIPVAQALIVDLGLEDMVYSFDALHCQKNLFEVAEGSQEREKKTFGSGQR